MTGTEVGLEHGIGEVYATLSAPGEVRGHHLHPRTREWFTVLQGQARLELEDPSSGRQRVLTLSSADPETVEVPPGIAHAIVAVGPDPLWLIAAASEPYDPADVVPYRVEIRDASEAPGEAAPRSMLEPASERPPGERAVSAPLEPPAKHQGGADG
jgi:oxalate decarboxylase/phosphoglucose isomerase-like protein (cupin superfamily)